MKIKYNPWASSILLFFFGGLIAKILYGSYQYDNIFACTLYLFFGPIFIGLWYVAVSHNKKKYKTTKDVLDFFPSAVGGIMLATIASLFVYFDAKVSAPSLLIATNHGVYADFKKNGNYIICSGSWASRTHFYGKYKIQDSIIGIDRKGFDDVLVSNRFVIRKIENAFGDDTIGQFRTHNYLIQRDPYGDDINNWTIYRGKDIDVPFKFEIVQDNRNN